MLKRGLPVIPVLIDHIRMPTEADLPPSLVGLALSQRSHVWTKDGTSTFMSTDSSEVLNSSGASATVWFTAVPEATKVYLAALLAPPGHPTRAELQVKRRMAGPPT